MARFEKGNPGKPKGATNKVHNKVKEAIVKFLEDNVDDIQESFDSLNAAQKLQFIAEVLPYAAPKLKQTELEVSGEVEYKMIFGDE